MLNKTRSDSRLAQLSSEQQAEIYRRLNTQTYAAVQRWLAQPPPDGLGLKTHINSLYRFFHRYDANASFENSMAAALSPGQPQIKHEIRLAAAQECGRLIASNPNALAAFSLLSIHFYQSDLAEISKANRAIALEKQQLALLRRQIDLQRAALRAKTRS
jgi:hypothetical protein